MKPCPLSIQLIYVCTDWHTVLCFQIITPIAENDYEKIPKYSSVKKYPNIQLITYMHQNINHNT